MLNVNVNKPSRWQCQPFVSPQLSVCALTVTTVTLVTKALLKYCEGQHDDHRTAMFN